MGKAVVLAGLSAGMIAFSGCGSSSSQSTDDRETLSGEPMIEESIELIDKECDDRPLLEDSIVVKKGEVDETLISVGEIIDPENPEKKPSYIDTPPSFPGGDSKLFEWLSQHLAYPPNAWDGHIQGRVIVSFMIRPDGSVCEAKVTKSVHPDLDNEALRVIKGLPRFNPAQLNGKAVEAQYTLPIVFKLNDE